MALGPFGAAANAVGETLTVFPGVWDGATPLTFAYAWVRCSRPASGCTPLPGASDARYVVASADVGSSLGAVITVTNPYGQASLATYAGPVVP